MTIISFSTNKVKEFEEKDRTDDVLGCELFYFKMAFSPMENVFVEEALIHHIDCVMSFTDYL